MGRALSIGLGNIKTGYACNCCLNPESPVIYAGEYVKAKRVELHRGFWA